MDNTIPIALLQLSAHNHDRFSEVWPGILARATEAAAGGAKLIVLPEGTIPGYVIGPRPVAPLVIEAALADLQEIADTYASVLVVGVAEPHESGPHHLRDNAVILSPRAPRQRTSKRFLWHFDSEWFDPGEDLQPIVTPIGTLGVLICADGRIPTIASTLVDRGAELLIVVTAWVSSGRDTGALENIQADFMARMRAWENATPLVAANKVGCEAEGVLYCGKSQAIAADGAPLAIASQDRPETLWARLRLSPSSRRPVVAPLALRAPLEASSRPLRLAVTDHVTRQRWDLAAWSSVDAILCATSEIASEGPPAVLALPAADDLDGLAFPGMRGVHLPDDGLRDPGYLVAARLAGYDLFVWSPQRLEAASALSLAELRAAELRAYLVLLPREGSISIVDPQGSVIAGTTSELRMAQFIYDPRLTEATALAPNTDVLQGLARTEHLRNTPPNRSMRHS
jgi:predicted amidohydrolase